MHCTISCLTLAHVVLIYQAFRGNHQVEIVAQADTSVLETVPQKHTTMHRADEKVAAQVKLALSDVAGWRCELHGIRTQCPFTYMNCAAPVDQSNPMLPPCIPHE